MTSLTMETMVSDNFVEQGLIEIFGPQAPKKAGVICDLHNGHDAAVMRGLTLRSGRAGFYYWMRQYAEDLGWKRMEFRLLPAPARIERAMRDATNWFNRSGICKAEIRRGESTWVVTVTGLTNAHSKLDCNFFTGFMQELAGWAGGGKFHVAHETQCQAGGAPHCEFIFDRQPAI